MSTPLSFPHILFGDDDFHKVSQEISFLTTVLKNCRTGKVQSAPSNSELQFFQHISTLVTTGRNGTIVNAVSGHVGADKIVSIVFTRNAGVTHAQDGTYAKITPSIPRGKALLETWKLKIPASFAEHLQNVVDALSYISSTGGKDNLNLPAKMTLFTLRCALPELSTRVHDAIRLWSEGPFHIVARYYRERTSPINVTNSSFALKCPKEIVDLQRLGLNRDETNSGKYHVDSENIGKWVNLIDTTYSEIERLVLKGGKDIHEDVLSFEEGASLLRTIGLFSMLIGTKLLIAAILAPQELDKLLQSTFRKAANTKNGPGTANVSTDESSWTPLNSAEEEEAISQDTLFEDDAFDGGDLYELEGGIAHMLRYFRKITAWYDAGAALSRNAIKYPALPFDVYHVNVRALPSKRSPEVEELSAFRERCSAYFQAREITNYRYGSALTFLNDKLGGEKLRLVAREAASAVVHVEATIMGFACISISGGEPFGNEETKLLFSESRNIPIALNKKCCRSCAILAGILKDDHGIDFVLPGTHTTFFPWSPPPGVPLDALRKMRDDLCVVFEELACAYVWIPNPSSETFDIEPLDLSLVSYIDTKPDGDAASDP